MESEFQRMQRQATEQLRQMNARASLPTPSLPNLAEEKRSKPKQKENPLDFLGSLFSGSSDSLLLGGLLLLLYKEKGDNLLLLALLYILM